MWALMCHMFTSIWYINSCPKVSLVRDLVSFSLRMTPQAVPPPTVPFNGTKMPFEIHPICLVPVKGSEATSHRHVLDLNTYIFSVMAG